MASLVRPWVVEYRDPAGRKCRKGTPGATRHRYRAAKWYGQGIPGQPPKRRIPLAADRAAAQRMLAELVRQAERGHAGLPAADPPLDDLVGEFADALGRKAEAGQRREVINHVRRVLAAVGATALADLRAAGLPARAEAFVWSLTRPPASLSESTAARYGKHARQFTRWLWLKRQALDRDPLAAVDLPSETPKVPRRDLTPAELGALFAAVAASPARFRGLDAEARLTLYLTAAATGLRAGELARLTADRFDPDPPAVRPVPRGERSKTREAAPLTLPAAVAARLADRLADLAPGGRVWPGTWHLKAAKMLRADLDAAGVPHVTPAGEAVFHSLRHSFASMVFDVAPVKVAQEMLRHRDPRFSLNRYVHATGAAKRDAADALPLPLAPRLAPAETAGRGSGGVQTPTPGEPPRASTPAEHRENR